MQKKLEEDDKNKVIEVLERELKHSKDKLKKSEEVKEDEAQKKENKNKWWKFWN